MAGLGETAREVQDQLRSGKPDFDAVLARMQQVADEAGQIEESARQKEMEDVAREADVLRQQILAARNKIALLSRKA